MNTTLLFIGPHGAGKTTLGMAVARELGWRFDEEIGLGLRREALARNPHAHAALAQPEFDEAVFRRELERDAWAHELNVDRVVETWHPGNLAYAELRSPRIADVYGHRLAEAARAGHALVQPLTLSRPASMARRTEPGPDGIVDFFRRVGDRALALVLTWGLDVLPTIATDEVNVEQAIARVVWHVAARRGPDGIPTRGGLALYSGSRSALEPR